MNNDLKTPLKLTMQTYKEREDESLDQLSHGVGRLRDMSITIHEELVRQNENIQQLNNGVDDAIDTLKIADKKLNVVVQKKKNSKYCLCILILLILIIVIFTFIFIAK
ncbi:MAG: hypothetical protein Edafosvirus5_16 [Edafosvirus sp.]|uniref:t-SNARE coiled-coil homology domain-containing protein n=1 Tax=Edafosvirus sp. TaxID=2487765 RepID=A0A3G4ZT89_9VIRU|nr:MAG: hypothetical protein Edafosvirus5_16 [Edafosvirus sp.]